MSATMTNKLSTLAAALVLSLAAGTVQAQAMRPEVGKPLQAASDLLKAGKGKEALAKVREAEAVGGKTAAEALMVEDRHLNPLRHLRPAQPHYLERGKPGKLVGDWNLVVPPFLYGKTWEET